MADLRLLVFGSRGWDNYQLLRYELFREVEIASAGSVVQVVVVHGVARGADIMAERAAKEFGWKVERHPADWQLNGKAAGPIRNEQMANARLSRALGCFKGPTTGSLDMLRRLIIQAVPVRCVSEKP